MRGSGFDQISTDSLVIAQNKVSIDANASFCAPRQKVARELDVSVLYPRLCSRHSADNRETSDTTVSGCNGGSTDNDFLFAGGNGGLMDKDLLFNKKPRSTQNGQVVAYHAVRRHNRFGFQWSFYGILVQGSSHWDSHCPGVVLLWCPARLLIRWDRAEGSGPTFLDLMD